MNENRKIIPKHRVNFIINDQKKNFHLFLPLSNARGRRMSIRPYKNNRVITDKDL